MSEGVVRFFQNRIGAYFVINSVLKIMLFLGVSEFS
jgi:hypothetical protein